ncbi:MAG: CbiX/SirB N-terminal domain-containing protein [Planctomycetes bacterium]|nr:CbiX/SirB N-terminal domain-containing protein [Planctomycetota bacterium]
MPPRDRSDVEPAVASEYTAVLLIAHGSRREEANRDLVRLAEIVRSRRPFRTVEIAYLEVTAPTIPDGARRAAASGAKRVLMLPYFLSAGSHVTEDLERHRAEAARTHPQSEFILCQPLGLHPLLIDVVFARLDEGV